MIDTDTDTEAEEKTEFEFSELSESAKETARNHYRSGDYPGYEWWDGVYEDAVRMGALMGIRISSTTHKNARTNRTYEEIDISFSGFSSQGDGASFKGDYRHIPDAVEKVKAETNDEELLRIASALSVLQLTERLLGFEVFSATITARGNYSHSGSMDVTVSYCEENEGETAYNDALEQAVTQLMRDLADWIYKNLEDEYDYLCSDEYVDERLEDDTFDEEGHVL